jgi:hypothetical protein
MFARFICATILHLIMIEVVSDGLEMMKFSLNHYYMFEEYKVAWLGGFLKVISSLAVEFASIGIICAAGDVITIVFNFIALAIINEFDKYVFASLKSETFKELTEREFCKNVFVINHTSSKKCSKNELTDIKDENGNLRPLRVTMESRTFANKCLFVLYKVIRTFYVGLFFYFMPFSAIIISTLFPIVLKSYY